MSSFKYLLPLQALASTLDEVEISDLRDQFDAIDVDKNGSISLEEMRQVKLFSFWRFKFLENDGHLLINYPH